MRALSKKLRFEIFKRDRFTCQYCGKRPPDVVLEVDHILAVAEGGSDEPDNLTTACFSCNRGKGANNLGDTAPAVDELDALAAIQEMAERRHLLRRQVKVAAAQREAEDEAISAIRARWLDIGGDDESLETASIRQFLKQLDVADILDAVDATERWWNQHAYYKHYRAWKYFCACCWTKIRGPRS